MWFFNKPKSIKDSGMLAGFTDWHSHILPGVDDGLKTIEQSLEVLKTFEEAGISKVWLTPHIMEDYPNTTESLRNRFAELKEAWNGNVEIKLASENMLDALFDERLESKDFLPLGDKGEYLLVETSYMNPPLGMDDMLEGVFEAGYTPVLAHPERYRYMTEDDYRKLKSRGILFQTNYFSSVGGYGDDARKKAAWLLKEGMIDLTGSDIHRLNFFTHLIEKNPQKSTTLESLLEVAANPAIK